MAPVRVLYIDDDPGIGRLVERALAPPIPASAGCRAGAGRAASP